MSSALLAHSLISEVMKVSILESLSGLQKNWFVMFVTNISNLNQNEILGVLVLVAVWFEA
jgi:hypothetical protein